jgi:hypothetical protein
MVINAELATNFARYAILTINVFNAQRLLTLMKQLACFVVMQSQAVFNALWMLVVHVIQLRIFILIPLMENAIVKMNIITIKASA